MIRHLGTHASGVKVSTGPAQQAFRGHRRLAGWRRMSYGLYIEDREPSRLADRLRAWTLVLPTEAAFTHLTAAELRGWWLPQPISHPVFAAPSRRPVPPPRRRARQPPPLARTVGVGIGHPADHGLPDRLHRDREQRPAAHQKLRCSTTAARSSRRLTLCWVGVGILCGCAGGMHMSQTRWLPGSHPSALPLAGVPITVGRLHSPGLLPLQSAGS